MPIFWRNATTLPLFVHGRTEFPEPSSGRKYFNRSCKSCCRILCELPTDGRNTSDAIIAGEPSNQLPWAAVAVNEVLEVEVPYLTSKYVPVPDVLNALGMC